MNRRSMLRTTGLTVGMLTIAGPAILLQAGCKSTKQLSKWTSVLIGALKDVSPILTDIGAENVTALIVKALPIAEKLKAAFDDNNNVDAFALLNNLIDPRTGVIVEIADAVAKLTDERKKFIQGILAIGMVALRLIAAQIEQDVPANVAADVKASMPRASANVVFAAADAPLEQAFNAVRFQ